MRARLLMLALVASSAFAADPLIKLTTPAGASLETVLAELNARGHHVVYSTALVKPAMTLRAAPASAHIDALLREILAPWKLRAVQAANGDWLIVADAATPPAAKLPAPVPAEEIESIDVTASRIRLA